IELYDSIINLTNEVEIFKELIKEYEFMSFDDYMSCLLKYKAGNQNTQVSHIYRVLNDMKNKHDFIKLYIKNHILKKIKYTTKMLSCSFIDVVGFIKHKCGFSGTTSID